MQDRSSIRASIYSSVCPSLKSIDCIYLLQVLEGNTEDGEKGVLKFLDEPVIARYVRFRILTFIGLHQCMRVEILGCVPGKAPTAYALLILIDPFYLHVSSILLPYFPV